MLAGLAMKWRWRAVRAAEGKPTGAPNLILGSNVQVVWEKFCRYWDVEPRYIPVKKGRYVIEPDEVNDAVQGNPAANWARLHLLQALVPACRYIRAAVAPEVDCLELQMREERGSMMRLAAPLRGRGTRQ